MDQLPKDFTIETHEADGLVKWADPVRNLAIAFKKTGTAKDEKLMRDMTRAVWQTVWIYDHKGLGNK